MSARAASPQEMAADGILVLTLDVPGREGEHAGPPDDGRVRRAAGRGWRRAPTCAGVVLRSGKPDGFIAGADIKDFTAIRSALEAETLSREGQALLDRLEALPVPVVAAIHGPCLGGGLEVALACRYRVASDDPKTVLGLPEVMLGLIPGAGGTQRLPRLIGLRAALDLILTGRSLKAPRALQRRASWTRSCPAPVLRGGRARRRRPAGRRRGAAARIRGSAPPSASCGR